MIGQPDLTGQILCDITYFYYGPRVNNITSEKLFLSWIRMINKERVTSIQYCKRQVFMHNTCTSIQLHADSIDPRCQQKAMQKAKPCIYLNIFLFIPAQSTQWSEYTFKNKIYYEYH